MIDPTCYDDRTDEDFYPTNTHESVAYALIVFLIAIVFGFGFFCGSVFA